MAAAASAANAPPRCNEMGIYRPFTGIFFVIKILPNSVLCIISMNIVCIPIFFLILLYYLKNIYIYITTEEFQILEIRDIVQDKF